MKFEIEMSMSNLKDFVYLGWFQEIHLKKDQSNLSPQEKKEKH